MSPSLKGVLRLTHNSVTDNALFNYTSGDISNHLYPSIGESPLDFSLSSEGGIVKKVLIPTRNASIDAHSIGESASLDKVVNYLLAINSGDTNTADETFLDVLHKKVYDTLDSRRAIQIDFSSVQPSIILMSKDIPIYFVGVVYKTSHYLVWANEPQVGDYLKAIHKNDVLTYTMPPLLNKTLVLQSLFIRHKVNKWKSVFNDNLLFMGALDEFLKRKSI